VWAINFSPDGKYILTASDDNTARLWEADSGREAARFTHERSVGSASYSPKANYIITSSLDTYANSFTRFFRVGDRQEIIDFTPDGPVKSAVFSQDERLLATAASDGTVRVWEVEGRRQLAQMKHEGLTAFAFSSGGAYLVTADDGKGIQIWSVDGGQRVGLWAREDLGKPVGFSPDGRYLATLSEDHTVRLRETSGGREAASMKHEDDVDHIVFSRDGEYVATVSTFEKTARVWRAADGRLVGRPLIHGDLFDIIVFSHDGRYAATAGQDKIIRVWEVKVGREVARLSHDDRVTSVSFSPDGQYLAAGGADGMARIWRLRAEDLIDAACGRLTRNLTREEWAQYLGDDAYSKTCNNLP
jgi:WD40 repeat protein